MEPWPVDGQPDDRAALPDTASGPAPTTMSISGRKPLAENGVAVIEQLARTRTIAAAPEQIFAVLVDPAQHQYTEPTNWVRDAYDVEPITEVGQIFGMHMFHQNNPEGHYRIDNKVIALEPGRTVAWQPGQIRDGVWGSGGWWWRYDLTPGDGCTDVTLIYDWTDVPEPVRENFGGFPAVSPEFLDESLVALERHVTGST